MTQVLVAESEGGKGRAAIRWQGSGRHGVVEAASLPLLILYEAASLPLLILYEAASLPRLILYEAASLARLILYETASQPHLILPPIYLSIYPLYICICICIGGQASGSDKVGKAAADEARAGGNAHGRRPYASLVAPGGASA
jgi:hypothetical protein